MGHSVIRCYLGFSTVHANDFSERLESRAAELSRLFSKSHSSFLLGLDSLHDAVDAAQHSAETEATSSLDRGLSALAESGCDLILMAEILSGIDTDLAKRGAVEPEDPLIYRERFFADIDYDEAYRNLAARGAALPERVFWAEVVSSLQSGGASAGSRLLECQLRKLQANLHDYIRAVEAMRRLPIQELACSLHGFETAVLVMGFIRFMTTCTYISSLCGHVMLLHEQEFAPLVAAEV